MFSTPEAVELLEQYSASEPQPFASSPPPQARPQPRAAPSQPRSRPAAGPTPPPAQPRREEPKNYTPEQEDFSQRMKRTKDYYKVLGVARDADDSTLKRAFRKVRLLH